MNLNPNTIRIFIDESGCADGYDPSINNQGERFFTLAAILIREPNYRKFRTDLKWLKFKYNKFLVGKELKSSWIRRSNPQGINPLRIPAYEFYKYPNGIQEYDNFCNELKIIVKNTSFRIISVTVDKAIAQSKYPHKNILQTALINLWERIYIFNHMYRGKVRIAFDPSGKTGNKRMFESYQAFIQSGSWFIRYERLTIIELEKRIFANDSHSSAGVQLADYCAYPIKREVESPGNDFFKEVVKPKLYPMMFDKVTQKYINMGMKVSLSK